MANFETSKKSDTISSRVKVRDGTALPAPSVIDRSKHRENRWINVAPIYSTFGEKISFWKKRIGLKDDQFRIETKDRREFKPERKDTRCGSMLMRHVRNTGDKRN